MWALLGASVLALLPEEDWLVGRPPTVSKLSTLSDGSLRLSNGLVSRTFVTSPNWGTVSIRVEAPFSGGSHEMLRGVGPEARLNLSCASAKRRLLPYAPEALAANTDRNTSGSSVSSAGQAVGGLRGQKRYALFDGTQWNLTAGADDWLYESHELSPIKARWAWTPGQRHGSTAAWPPRGLELRVRFQPPAACGCGCGLSVFVVYEIYDEVPTISKRVEIASAHDSPGRVLVETLVTDELHVGEGAKRRMHLETDFMPRKTDWSFAQPPAADPGAGPYGGARMNYPTWWLDPDYELNVHDESLHADLVATGLLLQLQYPLGPWQPLEPGSSFTFMTGFLTLFDSDEYERQSLARRRVVRTLFPQVTEAPLYFYSMNATSAGVRHVADQAAELGFEGVLLSFGSGFDPSSTDPAYIARVRDDTLYLRSKGLMFGGYTLMQNPPGLSGADYCESPDGHSGYNTKIADFTTAFHRRYRDNILAFLEQTTMEMLETDGPYEGATCAVTSASGFAHVNNSQLAQYGATVDFYRSLKQRLNTYNTVPDPYWSSGGTNKEPMGYTDEWNRVPTTEAGTREYLDLGRMYLYDGTLHKPTPMGWLGFELSRTPSPMAAHERLLEEALASYLGQGNLACYRGFELYDSPRVATLWKLWVAHYKRYRPILMADVIHVRRPTGSDVEVTLHVNASASGDAAGGVPAFANLFNPTARTMSVTIDLPVYYAGLRRGAAVRLSWGGSLIEPSAWRVPNSSVAVVRDDFNVRATVQMAPRSFLWAALALAT